MSMEQELRKLAEKSNSINKSLSSASKVFRFPQATEMKTTSDILNETGGDLRRTEALVTLLSEQSIVNFFESLMPHYEKAKMRTCTRNRMEAKMKVLKVVEESGLTLEEILGD